MRQNVLKKIGLGLFSCILFLSLIVTSSFADVIVNVLAVNGADNPREKEVIFSLPGEIKREDILDAAGLEVDYDVNDAGYYVHGKVNLGPKETKTFKVRLRDIWKVTDEEIKDIQSKIEQGVGEIAVQAESENPEVLKEQLYKKLEKIIAAQEKAEDINQRMDAYRTYAAQVEYIEEKALSVDYWKSEPEEVIQDKKTIVLNVESENPTDSIQKVKGKYYLPREVKPENVINREGFEVRFDEKKQQPFLFKEEDLAAGQKKNYAIAVEDVWRVPENNIRDLHKRTEYVKGSLKNSPFATSAQILYDQIVQSLDEIQTSQDADESFKDHISTFRFNERKMENVEDMVANLEKMLAKYREELEVSKIKNVMLKMRSLKSLAKVSRAIFDKKPKVNAAWKIIGAVMIFLAIFSLFHFGTWFMRSAKEKKDDEEPKQEEQENT